MWRKITFLFIFCFLYASSFKAALPLSRDSRWIVDESGKRVKLACVSWPSHMEAVVAEGLSKRPVDEISEEIMSLGFNCVRLTWPDFLFTNDSLASRSVRQSFTNLGLSEHVAGLQKHNPSIIDLSLLDAFQAVVASLAKKNVMIILDNHISKPGWCCSNSDGNGFFGDEHFNPELWIKGLTTVATTFNTTKNVVAMSLRNELRGSRQNVDDWYRFMQKGAQVVHAANPSILVILSGLSYDSDLSFLANKPVTLDFENKLVFEVHWYASTLGQNWEDSNLNQVCGRVVGANTEKAGFLLERGYPLFVSEFGLDMRGGNVQQNRFLNCFMGWAAQLDVDWALWTLPGSYYVREIGVDEKFGVYDSNWSGVRNQSILHKILALKYPFRGPSSSETRPHKVLFHPMTGLCVNKASAMKPLVLGPCPEAAPWAYTPHNALTIKGTHFCLQADGLGQPAKLGVICSHPNSMWEAISDSKMHLSSRVGDGAGVCLDIDSKNNIVTNECRCLDTDNKCDPARQWFKIIDSTRYEADDIFLV